MKPNFHKDELKLSEYKELIRYSAEGLHDQVLDCMKELRRGALLDVPSGQGALSKDLEHLGFKTVLGDIEEENIFYRNGRVVHLDLNFSLPFKDETFDYVACVEGIEHIENPHHLIKEFSRLLKRGGYLIITTPNVMTIKSRMRLLFYSYLDFFRYFGPVPPDEKHRIEEYDHQHLNPIYYGEMKFILEKYGFTIKGLQTNRRVKKWKTIFPLMKWLIIYKTKKKYQKDPQYTSDLLLEGEILIFVAKRENNPLLVKGASK